MPITRLLPATSFFIGQWSRKGAPSPTLAAGISPTDTTLSFSAPLKDENETVVAGKAFSFGIKKSNGWTETCTATSGTLDYDAQTANFTVGKVLTGGTSGAKALICGDTDSGTTGTLNLIIISGTFQDNETITDNATGSATANGTLVNSLSADGLTLSNVLRGIDPSGTDFITTNSAYADSHDSREPVFCNIPAFIPELFRSVLQGLLASGASDFILGIDVAGTITLKRSTGVGTSVGFLRWYTTNSKAQYSNNGTDWINFDDTAASVIFKVSATDTTPGYALTKLVGSSSITITQTGTGGNETLVFTTTLPTTISSHAVYTPAYLTGDTGAQTNIALWDSVSDGSFRATIDGTARNIDGIDFTASGALGVVTSMEEVAAVIQYYLRAVTGSTETVVWSTNRFILTSANTTSSSQFSVLTTSTGTVGTDISGAGASDWMDADTGNGVATAAVLNPSADSGKVVLLDSTGQIPVSFANFTGEIKMWPTATPPTNWLICDGSEVSRATYANLFAVISDTFGGGNGSTTFNLPNFKNRVPMGLDTTLKTVIDDCESAWTAGSNVTATNDTGIFKTGTKSVKLAVAAGATAGQILGYKTISVSNLYGKTRVGMWLYSSIALNSGDLQYKLDDTAAIASALETIDIPAIQANVWTKVYLTLANPATDLNLISHGIYQVNDKGAFNLYIDDVAYGENYELGATGGEVEETQHANEVAAHTHPVQYFTGPGGAGNPQITGATNVNPIGPYNTSSNTGGIAQNNRPKFMTINYIIRI